MHGLENKNSSNDCMVVWIKRKEKKKEKTTKKCGFNVLHEK